MNNNDIKILLLDSNSLINRAFHALPPLTNSDGLYTNAVYGYMTMLIKLITEEKPTHICAVFDCRAKTFRHAIYDKYKGTRKPMAEELAVQIPILQELLTKLGIKILFKEGYEADDILGTLAKRFEFPTIIVSGDRDCLQLVDDTTTVILTKRGISEVKKYTSKALKEEGFTPFQIIEYKAFAGDSSDNIPGCPGVGEKTAKDLLSQYETVDGVYRHIEEIKGKLQQKLIDNKESVYLSERLATIDVNAEIECKIEEIEYSYSISVEAKEYMQYLQFKKLLEKMDIFSSESNSLTGKKSIDGDFASKDKETERHDEKPENNIEKFSDEVAQGKSKIRKVKTQIITIKEETELINAVNEISEGATVFIEFMPDKTVFSTEKKTYEAIIADNFFGDGITEERATEILEPLFSERYTKVFFDAKKVMHILGNCGVNLTAPYEDVMLMAYLINNTKTIKSPEQLLEDYFFAAENESAALLELYGLLKEKLYEKSLDKLYYEIELPLIEVLYEMEKTGFRINNDILEELNAKYTVEINELLQKIYEIAGEMFNVNSTKQLAHILFEKLGLKHAKKTKTGYSVDAATLEELDHPIVAAILRYRELSKLKSTYIEGMKAVMNPISGKVHTCFNQCVTATGRLSSTEPNLQNIPVRRSEGREIRKMFVPSPECMLVTADYSQIELRLLAHFSEEPKLIEAYRENGDIHALTASKIFNVPLEDVTPEMRSSAKAVNFGIIYGISGFGLSKNAGVSRYQAKTFIEQYFATYPKIKEYMDSNVETAKKQGYLTTMFGRIRYFLELSSPKHSIRAFGERAAMNMPLQGTASDIIKISMLKVYREIKRRNLKAKLILQVHDELIVDAPIEEKDEVAEILKNGMETAAELRVPLTVNVASGKNWYESK